MVIAIDGYSSCGKSTLARDLAKALGYIFIDSGAMYRAVALYSIKNRLHIQELSKIDLSTINILFEKVNNKDHVYLNDHDVTHEIRDIKVSNIVSEVAAISAVRSYLVKLQQSYGQDGGIVMDGRDIGSVVFPDADFKFFITADIDIRTERRYLELQQAGKPLSLAEVKTNLAHRDHIDSTRADSPLVQLPDAIVVDTSNHTRDSQLELALSIVTKS